MSFKHLGLLLLVAALLASAAFYAGYVRLNYPSEIKYPIRGVDVSHHQGEIHWFKAGMQDVKFAYIKATEGGDYKDSRFLYNWQQAADNGIAHGAYHFFSFCGSGAAQAKNFLQTVPVDPTALPPALDLEFSDNCNRIPSRAAVVREVKSFVTAVSKRDSRPPVIYATQDFYKRYMEGHRREFPPHRLWIRNVVSEPSQMPCDEWTFWQFASRGHVPGMEGPIDLNVFCGSAEQFAQLTKQEAKSTQRRTP